MKNKNTIIIIGIILFSVGMFFSSKNAKKNGEIFINAYIKDTITFIASGSNGASVFKISNSDEKYVFLSTQDEFNDYTSFNDIAVIGDSVIKNKDGALLILLKKGNKKEYKYKLKY